MTDSILDDISHRRFNPLKNSWVLVSPHRSKRPWQGQQESNDEDIELPDYDPTCYLCPNNKRAQGDINPDYENTFLFINDYSAVRADQTEYKHPNDDQASTSPASTFFHAEPVVGQCHVMTFSRHHNRTLADLSPHEISSIIQTWKDLYISYRDTSESEENGKKYAYMQIFENKGPAMGCSNPHPHCQIWTTSSIPDEVRVESENMSKYQLEKRNVGEGKRHMLQDYVLLEIEKRERVIYESQDDDGEDGDGGKGLWVVVVPWWAVWPFEVMIIPKEHRKSLADLSTFEMKSLAKAISEVCKRYDNLFKCRFPYSMGIHQAPLHDSQEVIDAAYLHIHFYPPLLRSATVRKFLVGYEMLAEPQRDITPEQAASGLRDCGGPLYRDIKD